MHLAICATFDFDFYSSRQLVIIDPAVREAYRSGWAAENVMVNDLSKRPVV